MEGKQIKKLADDTEFLEQISRAFGCMEQAKLATNAELLKHLLEIKQEIAEIKKCLNNPS